ncbi:MAG: HIT family protein [Nanoarchaeota archaeon]|nr:HIT family protein [Nanoarchaeota archaeon]
MNACIFCKIVKGEVPSYKVYEDDNSYAFLDINPSAIGHTLIITKKHYDNFTTIPKKELEEYMLSLQKVCKGIDKFAEGYNILRNNGKVAGELISHVHFHIIPRNAGDGVSLGHWDKKEGIDMDQVKEEIKSLLKE